MAKSQITYNGYTKEYAGSKTLATAGKVMATDMVVEAVAELETKTVNPAATDKAYTPTSGKDGISSVTVKSVIYSIPSNKIVVGNTVTIGYSGSASGITAVTGTLASKANGDIVFPTATFNATLPVHTTTGATATGTVTIYTPTSREGDEIKVSITIPEGYYAGGTRDVWFPNILPQIDPDAKAEYILSGYKAYDENGALLVGTMASNGAFSGVITNDAGTTPVPAGNYTGGTASATPGTVTSGAVTLTPNAPAWDSTASKWNVVTTGKAAAPTVGKTGYVSGTVGTKNASAVNTATYSMNPITIAATGSNGSIAPSVSRTAKPSGDAWVDAASGAGTSTKPTAAQPYVQVTRAASSTVVVAGATVSATGYGAAGTTAAGHYTANTKNITVSATTATLYIPITTSTVSVSGSFNISSLGFETPPTYNSTSGKFEVEATATGTGGGTAVVSAAGWIAAGSYASEAFTADATSTLVLDKLGTGATVTGTATYKPTIATGTVPSGVTNAASGAATTTAPTTGVYVRVSSAAATGTLTSKGTVVTPGYGTASTYTQGSTTTTVGAQASALTYIPITTKTLANPTQAASVVTNASASTPSITSGQAANAALRITATETQAAGWTSGTKTGTFDIPIYIEDFHA